MEKSTETISVEMKSKLSHPTYRIYTGSSTVTVDHRRKTVIFTLIELLLVIAIIAILTSILLPALRKARISAQGIVCKGNLKNLGSVMSNYIDDSDGWFPSYDYLESVDPRFWYNSIDFSLTGKDESWTSYRCYSDVWRCPLNPNCSLASWNYEDLPYGYNTALGYYDKTGAPNFAGCQKVKITEIKRPSGLIMIGDSNGDDYYDSIISRSDTYSVGSYHNLGANIIYVDNHVEQKRVLEVTAPAWTTELYMMWGNSGYYKK